jgi:lipopolysaccharide biosynthesis regulator YciM
MKKARRMAAFVCVSPLQMPGEHEAWPSGLQAHRAGITLLRLPTGQRTKFAVLAFDPPMFTWLDKLTARRASRPDAGAAKFMKQGNEHVGHEAWDAAATCYHQALSIDADYVDARIGLGFVLLEQKQYREAEGHLTHALSLNPQIADAHYLLGKLYQERDDAGRDAAIDYFTKALQLKPDFEAAFRALYFALTREGQIERAKDLLGKAIVAFRRPRNSRRIWEPVERGRNYSHAINCHETALAIQPDSADVQFPGRGTEEPGRSSRGVGILPQGFGAQPRSRRRTHQAWHCPREPGEGRRGNW